MLTVSISTPHGTTGSESREYHHHPASKCSTARAHPNESWPTAAQSTRECGARPHCRKQSYAPAECQPRPTRPVPRSEEHTSELQSRENLVCRLLLEKKKISNNKSLYRYIFVL